MARRKIQSPKDGPITFSIRAYPNDEIAVRYERGHQLAINVTTLMRMDFYALDTIVHNELSTMSTEEKLKFDTIVSLVSNTHIIRTGILPSYREIADYLTRINYDELVKVVRTYSSVRITVLCVCARNYAAKIAEVSHDQSVQKQETANV